VTKATFEEHYGENRNSRKKVAKENPAPEYAPIIIGLADSYCFLYPLHHLDLVNGYCYEQTSYKSKKRPEKAPLYQSPQHTYGHGADQNLGFATFFPLDLLINRDIKASINVSIWIGLPTMWADFGLTTDLSAARITVNHHGILPRAGGPCRFAGEGEGTVDGSHFYASPHQVVQTGTVAITIPASHEVQCMLRIQHLPPEHVEEPRLQPPRIPRNQCVRYRHWL